MQFCHLLLPAPDKYITCGRTKVEEDEEEEWRQAQWHVTKSQLAAFSELMCSFSNAVFSRSNTVTMPVPAVSHDELGSIPVGVKGTKMVTFHTTP